jgi:hypothetical protein
MSYIRCLSNPEHLYIWGDEKNANISVGKSNKDKKVRGELLLIPVKTFNMLLKKSGGFRDVEYKGASIKEVFVRNDKKRTRFDKLLHTWPGEYQMRLSYKGWPKGCYIDMWSVTWHYICAGRA